VKRAAERQQARQQEHLPRFRQAVEKLLSPQVAAALELSYQWNAVTDQPVALFAVQGGACEISSMRDMKLWSASLASGAVLVHRADACDLEEELLVALEVFWQGKSDGEQGQRSTEHGLCLGTRRKDSVLGGLAGQDRSISARTTHAQTVLPHNASILALPLTHAWKLLKHAEQANQKG
jgi:hypothetical protein